MSGTGGFQTLAYDQPAIGISGDFANTNPRWSVIAGPGALVAGSSGVFTGRFAWAVAPVDADGTNAIVNSFGAGPVTGFCGSQLQGLNTTYLSFAGQKIQPGFGVTLYSGGDFLMLNSGTTEALPGMKAYANFADGTISFGATGAPTTGASATGSTITPETSSVTGSISGDVMTVTAVGSGTLYPGTTLSGTNVVTGTTIVSQLTPLLAGETTGGVGRYLVSNPEQTVASTTISGTYGLLTIGTLTTTGPFAVGDYLNATGSVVAGTQIIANVAGTGGTGGTMIVNNNTNVTSQTIAAASNVETRWIAFSSGLPGEIVKCSDHPQG